MSRDDIRTDIRNALRHNPGLGQYYLVSQISRHRDICCLSINEVLDEMFRKGEIVRQGELVILEES
ncbi:hypothetical protein HY968_05280 [Candidatus Kaiserbacteria bacterium]|nr:hypothetical protein [Candidatus Kaiserbacteria bacterium]